ncbi:putative nuclease HARBI1 [Daphnia carinata]|uniref:putative nuclease HARBI1 n=1 Tax=Daphnia carinata TaxID=120202 RepID=UPI00257F5D36|nr:putative nuclease HARBI1 [Daphnia carinata]XP_057376172.1 putative nuclease HARBI1 [Daphnia carinata]
MLYEDVIGDLEDMLKDFDEVESIISSNNSDIDSDEEDEILAERRIQRIQRLNEFYLRRGEIFYVFDNQQVYKTFRFDKPSIDYIVKEGFAAFAGLRGVVGAIDGTHIKISRPHKDEIFYVNRKHFHSINVQAICDANGKFLSVNASKPGSCHDAAIFSDSRIGQELKNGRFGDGFLVGDSGYACTPFLLTPYAVTRNNDQERFNTAQIRTRNIIERAFGFLKRRFHSLHGELRVQPGRACRIIMACFVLHNIALSRRLPDFLDEIPEEEDIGDDGEHEFNGWALWRPNETAAQEKLRLRRAGFLKRDNIAANQFGNRR